MKRIYNIANWKTITPLFILVVLLMGFAFPKYQNQINELAGEELTALDVRMGYTKSEVVTLFDKMGEEGRGIYQFMSSKIDLICPIVYGLLLTLLIAALLKNITRSTSKWRWLYSLPFAAILFDYLENWNVLKLLSNYPNITEAEVAFSSQMTVMKWGVLVTVLLVLVVLGVVNLLKYFRK